MAYVHRVVKAGPCVEHKKMQSFRVHTKGVKRGPNTGHTTEKQERINERVAEEHLRWDINANFGHRDLHAVLHYYVKDSSFEEILENKAAVDHDLTELLAALPYARRIGTAEDYSGGAYIRLV